MTQEQIKKAIEEKYPTDKATIEKRWGIENNNTPQNESVFNVIIARHEMCNEAALFGAELATPKWISVQDRLPEDGQWVIGANASEVIPVEYKRKKFYRLTDYYMGDAEYITHWQPLPTPPESK